MVAILLRVLRFRLRTSSALFTVMRPGVDVRRTVSQGEAVARPSTLYLTVEGGAIRVGGDVVELGRGTLEL